MFFMRSVEYEALIFPAVGGLGDDFFLVLGLNNCGFVAWLYIRFTGFENGAVIVLYLGLYQFYV